VPKDILLKRCFYCEEWIRLSYPPYVRGHYCAEYMAVRCR
jgi:hypothetical protein